MSRAAPDLPAPNEYGSRIEEKLAFGLNGPI
jgi:hypothetical protein